MIVAQRASIDFQGLLVCLFGRRPLMIAYYTVAKSFSHRRNIGLRSLA